MAGPTTPAIASARCLAARIRVGLAAVGTILLGVEPALHPRPLAAAIGLAVLAVTGLVHGSEAGERWSRVEESLACSAGVLIVTLGSGAITALTLIWLASAAVGVVARGGQVGTAGRVLVVSVLLSPMLRFGVSVDSVSLLATGCGLLLAVGRMSGETAELLRDPLTGTLSRAAFDAQFERLAAHADPHRALGVVLIDLDDFGAVNKRRGHRVGDMVLVAAAQAVKNTLRDYDLLGRVGGDEFAILVIGERPALVADRVLAALAAAGIDASAGVASSPRDGTDARTLLTAADIALRLSKRQGKRQTTSYIGPRLTGLAHEGAGDALDRLCAGEGVDIALQPIVNLNGGTAHAYEALARFDVREAVDGPLAWFTLADRFGRRRDLERACARAAIARLKDLPAAAELTVNLSPDMLDDELLLELVELTEDSDRLVLEVTERQAVHAEVQVTAAIARWRQHGVDFAVDDVGAGHAGLGQLALVRPEYLKLDRTIVQGLHETPDRATFVRSLTEYVQSSHTRVIAEGIETEADLEAVRAAGIELGQGYLFGRPTIKLDHPVAV